MDSLHRQLGQCQKEKEKKKKFKFRGNSICAGGAAAADETVEAHARSSFEVLESGIDKRLREAATSSELYPGQPMR